MEHTLPPAWLPAVGHSRYLANQLSAHPELIPELLATWQQPLSEALLQAPLQGEFPDDEAVKRTLRRLRHRAMAHLALRILRQRGFADVANVTGGYLSMVADGGFELEEA